MEEKEIFEDKGDIDQFTAEIYANSKSLTLTVPKPNVDFNGLEAGDIVKIWFKIVKKKKEAKQN